MTTVSARIASEKLEKDWTGVKYREKPGKKLSHICILDTFFLKDFFFSHFWGFFAFFGREKKISKGIETEDTARKSI